MKSRGIKKIGFTISSFFTIMQMFNLNTEMTLDFQELKDLEKKYNNLYEQLNTIFGKTQKKIAIAVSWWSDSIFLSFLMLSFRKYKKYDTKNIHFLHCNHKIRKESKTEAAYLKKFFKNYIFKYFERENEDYKTEEELRERRYKKFNDYCKEQNIKYIFFWHNLTDRIETSLMNTIRWCGLNWFTNMKFINTHPLLDHPILVIRPLLSLSKEEIENNCKEYNIKYFEDKTNFDTSTSLRNKIRHEFIIPLSQLSENNSFFKSWETIYKTLDYKENNQNFLIPIQICPYRNAKSAYQREIPNNLINITTFTSTLENLWIALKKGEIKDILSRLKNNWEGFQELKDRVIFIAHSQIYFIQSNKKFWEKELILEKEIKESWVQCFWKYKLDIPEELIWSKLRFPKTWDHYKNKLLTKRALNEKIPVFWRNILPLAEKDKKIIFVFEPKNLIY